MTTSDFIGTGLLVVSTVFLTALPARAQGAAATYTAAEADRGAAVYAEQCAQCHGSALSDGSAGSTPRSGYGAFARFSRWAAPGFTR